MSEQIRFNVTSEDGSISIPVQMSQASACSVARCAFFLREALRALKKKGGCDSEIPPSRDEKGNVFEK